MKEWLAIQRALLACVPRLVAAVVTGNLKALDNVQADVDQLHNRWHG